MSQAINQDCLTWMQQQLDETKEMNLNYITTEIDADYCQFIQARSAQ